jgi:hypothetical protein
MSVPCVSQVAHHAHAPHEQVEGENYARCQIRHHKGDAYGCEPCHLLDPLA